MHAHKEPEAAKKAEGTGAAAEATKVAETPKAAASAAEGTPASAEQVKELTDTLQRLQAEFENASKRMEKEKKEFMVYANASFVRELLPFVDSLEQAAAQAGKDANAQGMALLRKQFLNILAAHGFKEIQAAGAKFDPHQHEVMMNAEDQSKPDGAVLEEFQRGYKLRDLVLRPAKVKVNKLS